MQLLNGPLSGTTGMIRYWKKHSHTVDTHEEEEDCNYTPVDWKIVMSTIQTLGSRNGRI